MKTVRLYGDMGKRFGRVFRLDVATPAEALRALRVTRPGFDAYLREHLDDPFRVIVGGEDRDEAGLHLPAGRSEVIKIVPVVKGAKDGFTQILIGAALIAAAVATGGTSLAWAQPFLQSMGTAMVLGGVAQFLAAAPPVNPGGIDGARDLETQTFGSPTLTTGQGGCVPLCYGTMRGGGHLVSAGIDAQTWQDKGFGGAAPDNAGTRGGDGDTSPWVWAVE